MVEIDNEQFEKIISLTENYILNSKYYKIEEIDKLVYSRQNGIVYFFYIKEDDNFILKYIGKSTGKGFKTRLKAHFFGIGKGTQSKFEKINKEKEVVYKFIETKPLALRNFIEEILIERYSMINELWNYK